MSNDFEITFFLAHWALSDDLTTDNEIGPDLFHVTERSLEHVDATINTGIRPFPVAKARTLDQLQIIVFGTQYRDAKFNPSTVIPCSCIKRIASMLSIPPDKRATQRRGTGFASFNTDAVWFTVISARIEAVY